MKISVLLLIVASARAVVLPRSADCAGVVIQNIKYEQEVLRADINSPYQLAIDYDSNTLFFSYSAYSDEIFKSAYLNLKTNEFGIIPGIKGGFANAVDGKSNTVYLGGNNGIYKFDFDTKRAFALPITDDNIWNMFFKNELYYTVYPTEEAFKVVDGSPVKVEELRNTRAMFIAVDNTGNIYHANSSGLFCYKRDNELTTLVGEYNVNGMTLDFEGNLFFSTPSNLYRINDKTTQVQTLLKMGDNNIYGLVIENDGSIIYAHDKSLIRLKKTNQLC